MPEVVSACQSLLPLPSFLVLTRSLCNERNKCSSCIDAGDFLLGYYPVNGTCKGPRVSAACCIGANIHWGLPWRLGLGQLAEIGCTVCASSSCACSSVTLSASQGPLQQGQNKLQPLCAAAPEPQCGYGCMNCIMPAGGGKPSCARCTDGLRIVNGQCIPLANYDAFCRYDGRRCRFCQGASVQVNGTCVPSPPNCVGAFTINNQIKCLGCQTGGWLHQPLQAAHSQSANRLPLGCCMCWPMDPPWAPFSVPTQLATFPSASTGCVPCF